MSMQPRIPSHPLSPGPYDLSTLELGREIATQRPTVAVSTVRDSNYLQESRMGYSQSPPPHTHTQPSVALVHNKNTQ